MSLDSIYCVYIYLCIRILSNMFVYIYISIFKKKNYAASHVGMQCMSFPLSFLHQIYFLFKSANVLSLFLFKKWSNGNICFVFFPFFSSRPLPPDHFFFSVLIQSIAQGLQSPPCFRWPLTVVNLATTKRPQADRRLLSQPCTRRHLSSSQILPLAAFLKFFDHLG